MICPELLGLLPVVGHLQTVVLAKAGLAAFSAEAAAHPLRSAAYICINTLHVPCLSKLCLQWKCAYLSLWLAMCFTAVVPVMCRIVKQVCNSLLIHAACNGLDAS